MTDWGSHGSGSDHETQTPIVAWGAGVNLPSKSKSASQAKNIKQNNFWKLKNAPQRKDINQTDVASLMSALIGVNMPQNNVGKIPRGYLRMHISMKLKAAIANMLQIWEQFRSHSRKFEEAVFFHEPFPGLNSEIFHSMEDRIQKYEDSGNYDAALKGVDRLFDLCSVGVTYYQRYHRTKLYVVTSLSYLGFIFVVAIKLLKMSTTLAANRPIDRSTERRLQNGMVTLLSMSFLATYLQNVPSHYFFYYASSVLVWYYVVLEIMSTQVLVMSRDSIISGAMTMLLTISVIESLNASFFDRRWLSLSILIMMSWQLRMVKDLKHVKLKIAWSILCLVLLSFSFQPSVGKEKNHILPLVAGLLSSVLLIGTMKISNYNFHHKKAVQILGTCYLTISGLCGYASTSHFLQSSFRINPCHVVAWLILLTSLPMVFTTEGTLLPRLASLVVALQSIYLLLCITYEGIFLLSLTSTMITWMLLEYHSSYAHVQLSEMSLVRGNEERQRNVITSKDVQRALMFLFFSVVSFFGTGNIASLNSFDPKSIQTLVSVFNPFLMGSLLLMKVLIPFLAVACFVCVVQKISCMPSKALFFLVLLFSDIMGLHFFFHVTDQGSWQEIGTSLSHFVITEGIVVFLQVFWIISKCLLETNPFVI